MPIVQSQSKQDGINIIKEVLLLVPASKGGMPCIKQAAKPNLSTYFLPLAISFIAKSLCFKILQLDHYFRYLLLKKARLVRLKTPFIIKEENIISRYIYCTSCSLLYL